jgi:acetyl esterase/lipase
VEDEQMSRVRTPYTTVDGLVRVYPADASEPTPALVWAHGGGFAGGDHSMPEADWVASALAARGITVLSLDYRHAGTGFRYPVPSDDVLTAWRWTLEHAEELGIDPTRVVLGGASAGGNLAAGSVLRMLAGGESAPALPSGVFLAYPTLLAEQPAPDAELAALLEATPEAAHHSTYVHDMYVNYYGGPFEDAPLDLTPGRAAASELTGFPPVLMINDEIDPLRVSGEVFAATLVEAGVPLELVIERGARHGHLNRPDEHQASDSIERIVRWIARGFVPESTTTSAGLPAAEGAS